VGLLSLGSAELALGPRWRGVYRAFVAASTVLVLIVVLLYPAGRSDLSSGVFTNAPLLVNLASSVLTFPAAILMAAGAILGALRTSRWRSLWTAAGIIVISLAGFLFIVSIPVTLYYAEFLGVVLLFVGFGAVPSFSARSAATRAASGGA
ncbi:MAG TPA: hypothetical protein VGS18_05990, partial [Thermoplasmata archaeon]|nr:hypothetical protein [Thermoplasmata archaeon]